MFELKILFSKLRIIYFKVYYLTSSSHSVSQFPMKVHVMNFISVHQAVKIETIHLTLILVPVQVGLYIVML